MKLENVLRRVHPNSANLVHGRSEPGINGRIGSAFGASFQARTQTLHARRLKGRPVYRVRKFIPHFSKQRDLAVFVVIDQPEREAGFGS